MNSRRCLSDDEIDRLLEAADDPVAKAIIEVAYSSGLCLVQIAALRIEDIDLNSGTLVVRGGKRNCDGLAFIDPKTVEALRFCIGSEHRGVMFLNCYGNPLGKDGVARIVREARRRAGLEVRTRTPRRVFTTRQLTAGADFRELLGHKSPKYTEGGNQRWRKL